MTTAELLQIAGSIPTPVDPAFGPCRAYVEEHRGAWRLAFARDGGRVSEPAGPAFPFDRAGGRYARTLVSLVNARLGSAPRRAAPDLARTPGGGSGEQGLGRPSEAPIVAEALAGTATSSMSACAGCGGPLPPGRRGQRRLTCNDACRQRARYRRQADEDGADASSATQNLTPSRPSEAAPTPPASGEDQVARRAPRSWSSRGARDLVPEGHPGPLVLGLT